MSSKNKFYIYDMKMKHRILLLLLLLLCQFSIGQQNFVKDTLYLDEFKELSTKELIVKKCNSNVFHCRLIAYDSIVAYHAYHKYIFGNIPALKLKQYHSILKNKMNVPLDTNAILVIDYRKYIADFKSYKNYIDSLHRNNRESSKSRHIAMNQKQFKRHKKIWYKRKVKCSKKIQKIKNTKVIDMYASNKGADLNHENYRFLVQDFNSVFQNNFFLEKGLYKLLILKPNGDYFLKSTHSRQSDFTEEDIFNLLKSENWKPYQNEWNRRLKNLEKSFSTIKFYYGHYTPKKYCF